MIRTTRPARSAVAGLAAALSVLALTSVPAHAASSRFRPVRPDLGKPVPVKLAAAAAPRSAAASDSNQAVVVPAAGSWTVATPTSIGGVPTLATRARTVTGARGPQLPGASLAGRWQPSASGIDVAAARSARGVGPARVTVTVLSFAQARAVGLSGLVLRIARADGGRGSAPVALRIPDRMLNSLYGGDYAARVRGWTEQPATSSAAASSKSAGSRSVSAVSAARDSAAHSTVLTPQVSATPVLVAAMSTPTAANGTGSFSAASLRPASSWDVSAQTGDFSWSYPMRTPPAAAGPSPHLGLQYDSQSVDGETGSTNNQPSDVGDGWSLSATGSISRVYTPCGISDGARAAIAGSGDLCYSSNNATVTLAGHSGALVTDGAGWHLSNDDSTRVQYVTGGSNGTGDGGYWILTSTDGTRYFFGQGVLPAGGGDTQSAWTVPVCGNASTACSGTSLSTEGPFSTQAWQWNLDEVVDTHGNAEVFRYTTAGNRYAEKGTGSVPYTRGGQLSEIDYGLTTTNLARTAATDNVQFGYAARCQTGQPNEPAGACNPASPTTSYWPDVPWDQNCTSATACTSSQVAPTFWSTTMLSTVTTEVGPPVTGTATAVDVWSLSHSFPDPGDTTKAALWLTQVGHTGYAGGATVNGATSLSTPATVFTGATMQNRVWTTNGLAELMKYRITSIATDTGAIITVAYSPQQCTPAMVPALTAAPQSNSNRCFPAWWGQINSSTPAQLDWFHKYVVTAVYVDPHTGGANDARQETDYVYYGTPAWRFNQAPGVPDNQRSWSVWAGYSAVEVRAGDGTKPAGQTTTDYRFFQGLDGDANGSSTAPMTSTKSASLTAGTTTVTDSLQYAGRVFEKIVRVGANGGTGQSSTSKLSDTVTVPWSSETATSSRSYDYKDPANGTDYSGTLTQNAWQTGDKTITTSATRADGSTVTQTTNNTYDNYGRLVQVEDATSDAGTTCTTTTYVTRTDATHWMLAYPDRIATTALACSAALSLPADETVSRGSVLSDVETFYDDLGFGSIDTGQVSSTSTATGYSSSTDLSTATWRQTATYTYDGLGRLTSATDPNANGGALTTTTTYTPSGPGGLTKTVVSNNVNSWLTSTTYLPQWGVESGTVDQNGNTTTVTYDALGRTSQVWQPNRPKTTNTVPSVAYAYTLATTTPNVITTTAVNGSGGATNSYTIVDGIGKPIQTQAPAEGGGIAVVDTGYDVAGRNVMTTATYYATGTASGTRIVPTTSVPSQTEITYDGDGRQSAAILLANAAEGTSPTSTNELWRTSTSYPGVDRVDVTPPAGGTPTSTYTDSRGDTTKLVQYLGPIASNPQTETTSYSYDPGKERTGMTNPAGSAWSWTYNVLGQQIKAVDPGTGTTTTSYYPDGQLDVVTDNASNSVYYGYDQLGRKTDEFKGGGFNGVRLASWSYDTATAGLGLLASSTRYAGAVDQLHPGTPYTESIGGYSPLGKPTSTSYTLPIGAIGNNTSALTYTTNHAYAPDGGALSQTDPAEGGLAAEKLTVGYDSFGMPIGVSSTLGTLLSGIAYTHIGQIGQLTVGNNTQSYRTYTWDTGSGRLLEVYDQRQATSGNLPDHRYTYDNAGKIVEDNNSAAADVQCYSYDGLQNLTQAWTPTTSSTPCSAAPSSSNLAGPAPYWTSYTIDPATGNRTRTVEHATTATGTDTRDTYTYPASGYLTGTTGGPSAVWKVAHDSAPAGTDPVTGTWTQVGSGPDTYGYNAVGATTTMPGQTLAYDAEGHQASLTLTSGANSGSTETNIYDADGTLLLQSNPVTGTTAYLGDTELHAAAGSSTVLGTRTYTGAGQSIAERDANSDGTTTLSFLFSDPHGSALVALNDTTKAITTRYLDPYGNPRGPAVTWPSSHQFLNKPLDPLTQSATVPLTVVGARTYAPALGRFLTVDPLLETASPGQLNGYSYGADNPVNNADPTGQKIPIDSSVTTNQTPTNNPVLNGLGNECMWNWSAPACSDNTVNDAIGAAQTGGDPGAVVTQAEGDPSYVAISPHVVLWIGDPNFNSMQAGWTKYWGARSDPGNLTSELSAWRSICAANRYATCDGSFNTMVEIQLGGSTAAYWFWLNHLHASFLVSPSAVTPMIPLEADRAATDDQASEGQSSASEPANSLPTVVFSRDRAPGIAQNFDNAVANGAPTQLDRVGKAARDANRRAALRGVPPAPPGQSLDEYPFASTAQGGEGAYVSAVPEGEQNYQGGVLSRFYTQNGINPGDSFNVAFEP